MSQTAKLSELTNLIRSKNAGPFSLTFDFMFENKNNYQRVKDSGRINKSLFSRIYGISEENVEIYAVDSALGIKVTIPRMIAQGDIGESDEQGGAQFCALQNIEIP